MRRLVIFILGCCVIGGNARGQSMHFSQYYNAPMLLNPANTALMPDNDFRVGLNYRNQWAAVPVPYNTFSAFGDFKVGGNKDNAHNNWLGVGLAFFNDKAGDGDLSLTQFQASLAYHLQLTEFTMISAGLSGAMVQRSVNFDNLTFDAQWDGLAFNTNMPNNEKVGVLKDNYYTVGAGLNFAWFPNESVYAKVGGGVANINQPVESFYKSTKNTIAYRPTGNVDVVIKTGTSLIINPSVYYTTQSGASELVFGSLFRTILTDPSQQLNPFNTQLILGAYCRLGDALIGTAGVQVGNIQFMASYDITLSSLAPYNASYGALEFSLIYQGKYYKNRGQNHTYSCPRFF